MIALLSVPLVWWIVGAVLVWLLASLGLGAILGSVIHHGARQDWDRPSDSDWYGHHD
jgi:hypothetical protein